MITSMIHPTAIISPKAELGADIQIGPYCVVGDHVTLGDGCVLHSHVVIEGHSQIGAHNEFFPFAAIGGKTQDLKYQGEPTYLEIGDHNVFRENVTIHRGTRADTNTKIGHHNLFLCYAHVAHECQLGDHIILSNNATLAGHVTVEDHAIISGLSAVHQFSRIGCHSMVGGMTRVNQDVAPYTIIEGSPSSTRGLNQIGLQRRGFSKEDLSALKAAYKKLFLKKDINLSIGLAELKELDAAQNPSVQHLIKFIETTERGITR